MGASGICLAGCLYPEAHIFDRVLDRIDKVIARLAVSMQPPPDMQERVRKIVRDRALTNRDRHVIFQQVGEDLDFTAELIVANAFFAIWAQEYPDEVRALIEPFADLVPKAKR